MFTPVLLTARIPHATVEIAFTLRDERIQTRRSKAAAKAATARQDPPVKAKPRTSDVEKHVKKHPHVHPDDEHEKAKKKPHTSAKKPHPAPFGVRKTDPQGDGIRRALLRCRAENQRPHASLVAEGIGAGKVVIGGTPPQEFQGELPSVRQAMAWAQCFLRLRREELRRKTGRHISTVREETRIAEKVKEKVTVEPTNEKLRQKDLGKNKTAQSKQVQQLKNVQKLVDDKALATYIVKQHKAMARYLASSQAQLRGPGRSE